MKIFLIIAGILIIASAAVFILYRLRADHPDDPVPYECDLIGIDYGISGGMNGAKYTVSLTIGDDGVIRVHVYDLPAHGLKAYEENKTVSEKCVADVRDIIEHFGMLRWSECPDSGFFVHDAPTTHLTFMYGDGSSFRISSNQELPEEADEAIKTVVACILDHAGITKGE